MKQSKIKSTIQKIIDSESLATLEIDFYGKLVKVTGFAKKAHFDGGFIFYFLDKQIDGFQFAYLLFSDVKKIVSIAKKTQKKSCNLL